MSGEQIGKVVKREEREERNQRLPSPCPDSSRQSQPTRRLDHFPLLRQRGPRQQAEYRSKWASGGVHKMPYSAFARRTSNAQPPPAVSSSPPGASPSQHQQQAMSIGSATASMPGDTSTYSTNYGSIGGNNTMAYGGSEMSEFGSIGDFSREESSTTTSPSLSPIIGGNISSFSFGLPSAGNPTISQSLQASNDVQSLHSGTNSTFTNSATSAFIGSSATPGQVSR
jgi:hypothetical protein